MAAPDRQSSEVIKIKQPPMNAEAVAERHEIFCQEFVRDFNGVRAVIAAGYSSDRASWTFCDLRKRPEIARRIRELVEQRKKNHEVDITLVLDELYTIAMMNPGAFPRTPDGHVDLNSMTADQQRCISTIKTTNKLGELTVEAKTHDKLQAIIHYLKLNGLGIDLPPVPPDNPEENTDTIEFTVVDPKELKS